MIATSQGSYDLIVIGGGPAGVAGAYRASQQGLRVALLEAGERLGGIPLQCIHPGFGNFYYGDDLTGPEFFERLLTGLHDADVHIITEAYTVCLDVDSQRSKIVDAITPLGRISLRAPAVLYAAGARERHRSELGLVGDRVAGVYTAGEAQTLMDVEGVMVGNRVVVIGSGDIGLIMARRCALEGATVVGVLEMLPYPTGLTRNVVQCLHDFDIPLYTSRMATALCGKKRVERVVTAAVDEQGQVMPGTVEDLACDTVLLAAGLVPCSRALKQLGITIDPATRGPVVTERLETSCPGLFTAGNALAINDYVDYAATQGEVAADGAAAYVRGEICSWDSLVKLEKGRGLRLLIPHYVSGSRQVTLYARVERPMQHATICLSPGDKTVAVSGVTPGEMLRFDLTGDDFASVSDALTVEVFS